MTITEFILARITEDEDVARDVRPHEYLSTRDRFELTRGDDRGYATVSATSARVLAECEAKRRIVEDHEWEYADPYESWKGPEYRAKWGDTRAWRNCKRCGGVAHHPNLGEVERRDSWPCPTLRFLAAVYADHPDYDASWRIQT